MYVTPPLSSAARVFPSGLNAARRKTAPRGAATSEVSPCSVTSQVYAVPFVPTVIRLPSERNAAVTVATRPGLVNFAGLPVTALLSAALPLGLFGGVLCREPTWALARPAGVLPEICRGLSDPGRST